LVLAAHVVGLYVIYFDWRGIGSKNIPLSLVSGKKLTGKAATTAARICICLGIALIVFTQFMIQLYPEGLGH
jgi:hypothetical protein